MVENVVFPSIFSEAQFFFKSSDIGLPKHQKLTT